MARKNKYSRIKPKVSPLTYILIGLFFIGLVLTIILSIDTPKQSFNKRFELQDHNYELSSLKKVENKINNGENVLVIIQLGLKSTAPKNLLNEVQDLYDGNKTYGDTVDLDKLPEKIFYIEIKEEEELTEFFKEYEVKKTSSQPYMLAFKDSELVVEYDSQNENSEIHAENKERANLIFNIKEFFKVVNKEF